MLRHKEAPPQILFNSLEKNKDIGRLIMKNKKFTQLTLSKGIKIDAEGIIKKLHRILLPFRYPGGKFYAIKILRPFWQAVDHDEYREPLVGGGAVFFAKPKAKFNWINDKHQDLIITYKILQNPKTRLKLLEMVSREEASPKRHREILNMKPKNKLERAFKFFYLNRTSFSGKMKSPSWGYRPKRSLPPERWAERIIPCGIKLEGVKITCLDFKEVITAPAEGEQVLMFIDPPYYTTKQESHYSVPFSKGDHIRLAKLLKETTFKFILTYDDAPKIRQLYDWAYIYPVQFFYRLDNSRHRKGKRMKGFELVITNFKIKEMVQLELNKV